MDSMEAFIERMELSLSTIGLKMEKQELKDCLLKSGDRRTQIIRWAMSELGFAVDENTDIVKAVIGIGLCPVQNPEIVLGKCSESENVRFWTRLIHMVQVVKNVDPSMAKDSYKNNCDFWLQLSSSSELKNFVQTKVVKGKTFAKEQKHSGVSVNKDELVKERLTDLQELKQMGKDLEKFKQVENINIDPNFELKEISAEAERIKLQLSRFRQEMTSKWLPWMPNNVEKSQDEDVVKLVSDINEKVESLTMMCNNVQKIATAGEKIRNTKIEEALPQNEILPNLHV